MSRLARLLLPLVLVVGVLSLLGPPAATASPTRSVDEPVAAASVSAGYNHSCVVTVEQAVRCWGNGDDGRLGYGNTARVGDGSVLGAETAAAAGDVPLGGPAIAVGAGKDHTCALMLTGAVRCWGLNEVGQLGYGHTQTVGDGLTPGLETPADAGDVPLGGTAVSLSVSDDQTCVVLDDGAIRCWGAPNYGKLGYGIFEPIGDDETPADVGDVPLDTAATGVATGVNHTCALLVTGAVRCWGQGVYGALGYGSEAGITLASNAPDVAVGGPVTALSAGTSHTCAVLDGGGVRCWGNGDNGRLGYGDLLDVGDGQVEGYETPEKVGDVPVGGPATAIAAAGAFTCAVLESGGTRCWGWGLYGRTGYAMTDDIGGGVTPGFETPADAGDLDLGGTALTVSGENHACAVLAGGTLRCWGHGNAGKLGYGVPVVAIGDDETPASFGDVPVGALVQTVAPVVEPDPDPEPEPDPDPEPGVTVRPKHTLKAKPKRDRRAPYVFRLKGALTGDFVADADTCAGKAKIVVTKGKRTVAKKKASLSADCTYATKAKLKKKRLGKVTKKTKLQVVATHRGSDVLEPSSRRIRVIVR
ncbi:hypothetical protein [Nocardioides sp.]|uniref:hypothetical protein n=1 Tax=Nocardioides sp. TaxID=35761 RepID=UPI00260EE7D3|nr:hypothetical protein [Nocardioides sp.]